MSQHRFASSVADHVDVWFGCFECFVVDNETTFVGLDRRVLQTQVLGQRAAADRYQNAIVFLNAKLLGTFEGDFDLVTID